LEEGVAEKVNGDSNRANGSDLFSSSSRIRIPSAEFVG